MADKPKVYEPKDPVVLTPERIKELLEEGRKFAAEIKKQTDQMVHLDPVDYIRRVR